MSREATDLPASAPAGTAAARSSRSAGIFGSKSFSKVSHLETEKKQVLGRSRSGLQQLRLRHFYKDNVVDYTSGVLQFLFILLNSFTFTLGLTNLLSTSVPGGSTADILRTSGPRLFVSASSVLTAIFCAVLQQRRFFLSKENLADFNSGKYQLLFLFFFPTSFILGLKGRLETEVLWSSLENLMESSWSNQFSLASWPQLLTLAGGLIVATRLAAQKYQFIFISLTSTLFILNLSSVLNSHVPGVSMAEQWKTSWRGLFISASSIFTAIYFTVLHWRHNRLAETNSTSDMWNKYQSFFALCFPIVLVLSEQSSFDTQAPFSVLETSLTSLGLKQFFSTSQPQPLAVLGSLLTVLFCVALKWSNHGNNSSRKDVNKTQTANKKVSPRGFLRKHHRKQNKLELSRFGSSLTATPCACQSLQEKQGGTLKRCGTSRTNIKERLAALGGIWRCSWASFSLQPSVADGHAASCLRPSQRFGQ